MRERERGGETNVLAFILESETKSYTHLHTREIMHIHAFIYDRERDREERKREIKKERETERETEREREREREGKKRVHLNS